MGWGLPVWSRCVSIESVAAEDAAKRRSGKAGMGGRKVIRPAAGISADNADLGLFPAVCNAWSLM